MILALARMMEFGAVLWEMLWRGFCWVGDMVADWILWHAYAFRRAVQSSEENRREDSTFCGGAQWTGSSCGSPSSATQTGKSNSTAQIERPKESGGPTAECAANGAALISSAAGCHLVCFAVFALIGFWLDDHPDLHSVWFGFAFLVWIAFGIGAIARSGTTIAPDDGREASVGQGRHFAPHSHRC